MFTIEDFTVLYSNDDLWAVWMWNGKLHVTKVTGHCGGEKWLLCPPTRNLQRRLPSPNRCAHTPTSLWVYCRQLTLLKIRCYVHNSQYRSLITRLKELSGGMMGMTTIHNKMAEAF